MQLRQRIDSRCFSIFICDKKGRKINPYSVKLVG